MDDCQRRERAGIPSVIAFRTKGELAREQIETALAADRPHGVVLADAAYGDEADFRQWLSARDLDYVLGVRSATRVWWDEHQPAPARPSTRGRPRTRLKRDARHQPIGVLELARSLPASGFRTLAWREGTNGVLSSRFAGGCARRRATGHVPRSGCSSNGRRPRLDLRITGCPRCLRTSHPSNGWPMPRDAG